ncbi:MAG: hypothetical protein U0271_17875 [Polyangiaceae bacterium]
MNDPPLVMQAQTKLLARSLTLVAASALLAACNLITGADQFVIDDENGAGGDASSNGGSDASTGAAPAQGGAPIVGEGGGTDDPPPPTTADATGVSVREVAFYQAVKSSVFSNGAPTEPSVDLVAGRQAVVRVFLDLATPSGSPVTARLTLGDTVLEQTVNSVMYSTDQTYGTTINFDVPAAAMNVGMTWSLALEEPYATGSDNPGARVATTNLTVKASHTLKITLIPVMYGADGSNRVPDTSDNQVARYHDYFMTLYPTTDVRVQVGPTFQWDQSIDANGNGWDTLLNALSEERSNASVDFDEYYYGVFEPAGSFNTFCGQGCVAGLGFIGDPNGEYSRAAIGLGYGGDVAAWTAVHEVGHNHGRPHSPCGGVSGADSNFPHSGGAIGVYGMNIFTHELVSPTYKDFMGYCDPNWISDYVFEKIFAFMRNTDSQAIVVPPEAQNQPYERIAVNGSSASFLTPMTMKRPPLGTIQDVTITTADGTVKTVQGTFYAYDHLPGGVVFVKQPPSAIVAADLALDLGAIDAHTSGTVSPSAATLVKVRATR